MTSIAPFPNRVTIDQALEPLKDLKDGVKAAQGKTFVPQNAQGKLDAFHDQVHEFGGKFEAAVRYAIDEQDGRTFPWAVGGSFLEPAIEPAFEPFPGPGPIMPPRFPTKTAARAEFDSINDLVGIARSVDKKMVEIKQALTQATQTRGIDSKEADHLRTLSTAVGSWATILTTMVEARAELGKKETDQRPTFQIFNQFKAEVNKERNDAPRSDGFGLWTKFDVHEARDFIDKVKHGNLDTPKAQDVMRYLYDVASSEFGDLVLTQGAADALANRAQELGIGGMDWNKAVNVIKNEHPIVALYAVALDDAINNGASARELEVMVNAGEAAINDLSRDFMRAGPITARAATAGAVPQSFMGTSNVRARANQINELNQALVRAREHLAALS